MSKRLLKSKGSKRSTQNTDVVAPINDGMQNLNVHALMVNVNVEKLLIEKQQLQEERDSLIKQLRNGIDKYSDDYKNLTA